MSKTLVLAEKPSVGRELARVLKCSRKSDGCLIGDKYIVTWALGHVVTVADPEADGRKTAYDYACRRIPERLRSWGFNAFGNSCSQQIVRAGRMPYAHTAHQTRCPQIAGAHGNWANFDDVFSPDYAGLLARNLKQDFGEALQDPYCIGLYVHNEIGWGRDDADWRAVCSGLRQASPPSRSSGVCWRKNTARSASSMPSGKRNIPHGRPFSPPPQFRPTGTHGRT